MNLIRTIILFGNLLVTLLLVNWGIWSSEQTIANETVAYLELGTRDPRSFFQGDYMVLNYAIEGQARISRSGGNFEREGFIVVRLDEQRVVRFLRFDDGSELAEGEVRMQYTSPNGWSIEIGVDSYFFQEGLGSVYANALYAEIRILDDGSMMLIGLRGADFQELRPE
jgi:uncharacterized membrane-anchored protein